MSSSSEPIPGASYARMEYREASEDSKAGCLVEGVAQQNAPVAELRPDPAKLFAVRLEEEKRTIAAQSRVEAEREIQRARAAITQAIEEFARQRDSYFRQVEGEVVQLALAVARRIVHRESQIEPQLLAALVRHELEQLDSATSVRLVVSPDALVYWKETAAAMPRSVEVCADRNIVSGNLRMETALGSTVIDFEGELKEIERGFFDLLSHRPATETFSEARVQ